MFIDCIIHSHGAGSTCAIILLSERRYYGVKGVSCDLNN
jgi:hypothetical protein